MDELERALRAVLDDPGQLQELRTAAASLGLTLPAAEPIQNAPQTAAAPSARAELPAPAAPSGAPGMQELLGGLLRQTGGLGKKQQSLLQALRPFLRRERQEKLDRALQAAQLAAVAGVMLKNRRGAPGSKEGL